MNNHHTTRTRYLMNNNRANWIVASVIFSVISMISAVSANDVDLAKLDVKSLVTKMTPLKGTTPAQWRVVWTDDASRKATISWTTAEPGEKHVVYYGTKSGGREGKPALSQECQSNGIYTITQPNPPKPKEGETPEQALKRNPPKKIAPAYYHHARIKELKPNTRYYFVLESDGERSREFYFRTAPAEGTDFTLIHGGDSRSGHANRCRMNLRIAEQAKSDSKVLAFAHGGDYIVSGVRWEQWRLWLSQHELTTLEDGRVLPIIPTKGNHDGGKIYFEVFDLEEKTKRWHTTMLGKDVALVTLDTNSPGGGPQAEWLEAELKRLRPAVRWLIVQYHRPMYPAVKGPATHAPIFCPLFDKYNVDIALESDGHCMKRTVPIRDGKKDPTGIVYVGEGGLGVGQRKTNPDRWYLKDGGKAGSAHHVIRLDFNPDDMRVRFILMDGSAWDDHTIKARNH